MATRATEARCRPPDPSWPQARLSGALRGLGPQQLLDERDELGRNGAPAGGLALSADDMAAWLKIQLAHGALPDGTRLFSEKPAAEKWAPVTPMPSTPRPVVQIGRATCRDSDVAVRVTLVGSRSHNNKSTKTCTRAP